MCNMFKDHLVAKFHRSIESQRERREFFVHDCVRRGQWTTSETIVHSPSQSMNRRGSLCNFLPSHRRDHVTSQGLPGRASRPPEGPK